MLGFYRQLSVRLPNVLPSTAYLRQLFSMLWSPAKPYTVAWIALLFLSSILPVASMLVSKRLVDGVVLTMRTGITPFAARQLLFAGGLLALIAVMVDVLSGVSEWVRTAQTELIQEHVSDLIQQKSTIIDFALYENPEFYDRLFRARDEAKARIPAFLEFAGSVFQNCLTVFALSSVIASYNANLLLALGFSLIPAFFVIARFNWLSHRWWKETTPQRRWIDYYDQKFSNPNSAAEIRLLHLGPQFRAAYRILKKEIRVAHLALVRKQSLTRAAAALAGIIVAAIPVGWIALQAFQGKASFGDMVVFYQAFVGGQGFVRMITSSAAQVYSNLLYMSNLCEYLSLQPKITDPLNPAPCPVQLSKAIEFRNVTFRYPGSERIALDDLNLTIPEGKIVAVVGPNGAGKSTLVKLLCRFYDPDKGSLTIDGISLKSFALKDVRSFFSVLFQIPVHYDATAAENISVGDVGAEPSMARIEESARSAGAHETISRLPRQYDTLLGKSFANGTDLSTGEWQRVSMARAFYRQAPVVLLDEPTSFMDPWSEASWFDRVRSLMQDRTAVIVTHRFTIAMRADLIYVMKEGRVIETGTHAELLAGEGLYAESWHQQFVAQVNDSQGLEMQPLSGPDLPIVAGYCS